jgi:hypothetical protein
MGDFAGYFELIPETFGHPPFGRDLRFDELESDFFIELGVVGAVDAAHASGTQFLDDLVAASEYGSSSDFLGRGFKCFSE